MKTTLAALALLVLSTGDARACINDMEQHAQETGARAVEAEAPAEQPMVQEAQPEAQPVPEPMAAADLEGEQSYVQASVVGGAAGLSLLLGLGLPLHQRRKVKAWEALD